MNLATVYRCTGVPDHVGLAGRHSVHCFGTERTHAPAGAFLLCDHCHIFESYVILLCCTCVYYVDIIILINALCNIVNFLQNSIYFNGSSDSLIGMDAEQFEALLKGQDAVLQGTIGMQEQLTTSIKEMSNDFVQVIREVLHHAQGTAPADGNSRPENQNARINLPRYVILTNSFTTSNFF